MNSFSQIIKLKTSLINTGENLIKKESLTHHLLNTVSISFDMLGNIIAKEYSEK